MSHDANFYQKLGIDLVQTVTNELEFLEQVADYLNHSSGPLVKEAIRQ